MTEQITGPTLRQQNIMTALRVEMGWPEYTPANNCITFCSGNPLSIEVGREMARISQQVCKDAVYAEWVDPKAKEPGRFSVIYREMEAVDVIDRVMPYASDEQAPIILVRTRGPDEHFAIDARGSLQRVPGKPKNIGAGHKLAMKRIKAKAATLGSKLFANNQIVEHGADWIQPDADAVTFVRFN